MKIAVSAEGPSLDSRLDPRFGRCAWFLIVDSDNYHFEAFENPNITLSGGAGIQSAQNVVNLGVGAVITGNCGPNAYKVFETAGVQVITGCSGMVREVVEDYKAGRLTPRSGPNVDAHYDPTASAGQAAPGAFPGGGRGMGGGGGRGMGGGGGRGMGGGGGRGMGGGGGRGGGGSGGRKR